MRIPAAPPQLASRTSPTHLLNSYPAMAESDSDQSSLDPSDIIERYVDSDASALSQSPPPIHDLSAEVARLLVLDHYFSPSEESDDARSPELSPHRRRHGPQIEKQRVVPFDVESTTLAVPLAIQRLQSSESIRCLVAGSLQGSARSSLSQLSDECAAKPLAEELEEAEREEKLRNEAVLFENFETDSSSVSYSGEEESGEEGPLLSDDIV